MVSKNLSDSLSVTNFDLNYLLTGKIVHLYLIYRKPWFHRSWNRLQTTDICVANLSCSFCQFFPYFIVSRHFLSSYHAFLLSFFLWICTLNPQCRMLWNSTFPVVYFDQRTNACKWVRMVENDEKHLKIIKSTYSIMCMRGSWKAHISLWTLLWVCANILYKFYLKVFSWKSYFVNLIIEFSFVWYSYPACTVFCGTKGYISRVECISKQESWILQLSLKNNTLYNSSFTTAAVMAALNEKKTIFWSMPLKDYI